MALPEGSFFPKKEASHSNAALLLHATEPGIQGAPPADRSVGQLRRQAAIGASQGVLPQGPFQGDIGIGPGRHRLQHLPGEPSWS